MYIVFCPTHPRPNVAPHAAGPPPGELLGPDLALCPGLAGAGHAPLPQEHMLPAQQHL